MTSPAQSRAKLKLGRKKMSLEEYQTLANEGYIDTRADGTTVVLCDLRDDPEHADPLEIDGFHIVEI